MSKKPAPPPGSSGRARLPSDAEITSNSSLLLAGLDGLSHNNHTAGPITPPSPSPSAKPAKVEMDDTDLPPPEQLRRPHAPPGARKMALNVPPVTPHGDGGEVGLLLSPRADMRRADLGGVQMRDAPPVSPSKRATPSPPAPADHLTTSAAAKSPTDFTHAVRVLSHAYDEILTTLSDIEDELINIKDTNELRERKSTIRIVVTLKQLLEPVPLVSKERRETRMSNHSKEVLLLVFYKNTEDSLWIIRQKLSHLHTAIQNSPSSSPSHATLVSVGHLFRSVSQTLAMYDAKAIHKKGEKGDRPKSADLTSQQTLKPLALSGGSMIKPSMSTPTSTPPVSPSTHVIPPERASSPAVPSPTTSPNPVHLNLNRVNPKARINSVTLVPRAPVGPTSPSRPLVPPPPSDFEIYKDEHGEDLIRAGTYSALVYLLTHPDFEQGLAGMQAFILVHRYQHSPSTLFNILETIYDEVVLRKFAEGPATSLLLARFFCVWIEFALMPEFLINRRTIPSWPLSLYDRLLLFLQKYERNGQFDEANAIKLTCLRSFHHYHAQKRFRKQERRRLGYRHSYVVPASFLDTGSTDSSSSSNVERLVQSLDRARIGAPLSPSSSSENVSITNFIKSGVMPFPANNILARLSPQAMAEQLTIKEMLLFRRISDREFVTYKTKAQPKVTFIGHLVSWFNVFSHAVAGEVLSCALAENRAELITRFIDTGVALRSQGNFNGVMEILAALNLLPVSRLTKTWAMLTPEKLTAFKELEAVMDSRSNFHNYRREFAAGGVKLPYMGIFSRDCVFLNEANSDLTASQLWNWEKILLKGKQVYLYKRLQQESVLTYPEIEEVQVAFNGLVCPDVDELYNMSLHLEPRKDDPLLVLT